MRREPQLGRILWFLILIGALAAVIASFAQRPLFGEDGEASGFAQPMTLWIASADFVDEAQRVIEQATSRWDTPTRVASAEVLPGGSVTGVTSFLERVHGDPDDLLVISSSTLADIAHDGAAPQASEIGMAARYAMVLLRHAPVIAVVCTDPLLLAVPRDSLLRSLHGLARSGAASSTPLFSITRENWETANLAALVERYGLTGRILYSVASSAHAAVTTAETGQASVVLAARSEIRRQLRAGRMRRLPWPPGLGSAPQSWIAILGPTGLSSAQLQSLRARARELYRGAAWEAVLRAAGFSPASLPPAALSRFVDTNLQRAIALQDTAVRLVREY
jgi:tripartite-type tricarboxylate transporter receptor subunit TctC